MVISIIELAVVLIGLLATAVLFYRFPRLPVESAFTDMHPSVSIIIPARNEERNLGLLLGDIAQQSISPFEIICVDDASEDRTAEVAREYGVHLISVHDKPAGWTGKTWACQRGAETAGGDILLFLDADVRLAKNGLSRLIATHISDGGTISVQPFHRTEKCYEQLSLMFNLVQIAANGTALPWGTPIGLYGPVILISRADYLAMDGHKALKNSIVEDMSMGIRLKALGLSYQDFVGDTDISFRMYGGGFRSLLEGWTKNIASGAAITSVPVFLLVFFWIASLLSVPFHMMTAMADGNWVRFSACGALYIVWVMIIRLLSKKTGKFSLWSALFYPLPLAAFLLVFALSATKKVLRLKVRWKGRVIPAEGKSCE